MCTWVLKKLEHLGAGVQPWGTLFTEIFTVKSFCSSWNTTQHMKWNSISIGFDEIAGCTRTHINRLASHISVSSKQPKCRIVNYLLILSVNFECVVELWSFMFCTMKNEQKLWLDHAHCECPVSVRFSWLT